MLFSIIIPSYNRAYLISETIASVQNQTFTNWECIVIDDGSKDNTKEVIESIIKSDQRIKFVYQNNAERSAARNNGLRHALGEYICFLDSDDHYKSEHLEMLNNFIIDKQKPEALIFTDFIFNKNGKTELEPSITYKEPVAKYLLENAIIPARVCVHKNILKDFKFDEDITIVEDTILWLRIAQKYPILHLQEETVIYSVHDDNSINHKNNGAIKRLNGLKIFFKRYPEITRQIPTDFRKKLISDTLLNISKHYIYHQKKLKAIKYLLLSLFYKPIHHQTKHKIALIINLLRGKKTEYHSIKNSI